MSISAIFGRDHSLLITWGGGRCRNIFFSGGGSIEVFFWGVGGIKLFYFGGITWFSGQTESVVADRVLNWGDYKNWMPRYLLSWFLCHTSDPSSKASTSHVFTKFKSWSLIPLSLWERWRWSARSTPGQEVWIRGLTRKLKCICGQDTRYTQEYNWYTQEYNWLLENCQGSQTKKWGGRGLPSNIPNCFMPQRSGLASLPMTSRASFPD